MENIKELLDKMSLSEIKEYLVTRLEEDKKPKIVKKQTASRENKLVFWLDAPDVNTGVGGIFLRNELFKTVEKIELAERKVVGIVLERGSWNLEILIDKELE